MVNAMFDIALGKGGDDNLTGAVVRKRMYENGKEYYAE